MKCERPAFASVSSREPAPIQKPSATERTCASRSEMTRSPESSSVSTYFCCTRGIVLAAGRYPRRAGAGHVVLRSGARGSRVAARPPQLGDVERRDRGRGRAARRPAATRPLRGGPADRALELLRRRAPRQDLDLPRPARAALRARTGAAAGADAARRAARDCAPLRHRRRSLARARPLLSFVYERAERLDRGDAGAA